MPAEPTLPTPTVCGPPALLTMALILKLYLPVKPRTFWRWIASEKFPPPDLSIGAKVPMWRRETVENWIALNATGGADRTWHFKDRKAVPGLQATATARSNRHHYTRGWPSPPTAAAVCWI